ncbi:hypothetical protein PUN28_000971 [Cardiocondyla obscurior]|uniref:Uncharacterized protein n=1 Tax=Cardiocondyla obscurior TaxID=286306 RepID=A0AAW2H2I5_9HYME
MEELKNDFRFYLQPSTNLRLSCTSLPKLLNATVGIKRDPFLSGYSLLSPPLPSPLPYRPNCVTLVVPVDEKLPAVAPREISDSRMEARCALIGLCTMQKRVFRCTESIYYLIFHQSALLLHNIITRFICKLGECRRNSCYMLNSQR